jgi:hypothetical protein
MGEKLSNLGFSHRLRMALLMKKDEAPNPVHVGRFGTDAVMLYPQMPTNSIEEPRWLGDCRRRRGNGFHDVRLSGRGAKDKARYYSGMAAKPPTLKLRRAKDRRPTGLCPEIWDDPEVAPANVES